MSRRPPPPLKSPDVPPSPVPPSPLRFLLGITIAVYLVFQIFYVTATPLQEIRLPDNLPQAQTGKPILVGIGPDEKEHFLYIVSLAERGKIPAPLPRFRKSPDEYVSYQAQHPPLFYAQGAIVYKIMGGADTPTLWYILRGLCALCGVFTILFATRAVRDAFPSNTNLPLVAAPFVAFLPMFGFMNGTLSNEPLALALGAFVWWKTAQILQNESPPPLYRAWMTGFCLALALATRLTAIIWLLPFLYALWRRGGIKTALIGANLPICALAMLFLLNFVNYDTPFLRTFYRPAIGLYTLDVDFFRQSLLYYNATAWYPHWLTQFYLPGGTDGKIMAIPLLANVVLFFLMLRALPKLAVREKQIAGAAFAVVGVCVAGTVQQQLWSDWNVVISAGRYLVASLPAVSLLLVLPLVHLKTARAAFAVFLFMLGLNLFMVNLVRTFYQDHPTQSATQHIEEVPAPKP